MFASDKVESYYLQSLEHLRNVRKENSSSSSIHDKEHVKVSHCSLSGTDSRESTQSSRTGNEEPAALAQPADEEFVPASRGIAIRVLAVEKNKALIQELLHSQPEIGLPLPYESQKNMLDCIGTCQEFLEKLPQYQPGFQLGDGSDWEELDNATSPSTDSECGSRLLSALHQLKNCSKIMDRIPLE